MTIEQRTDARGRTSYRPKIRTKDADGSWRTVSGSWTRSKREAQRIERDLGGRRDAGALASARGMTLATYLSDEWFPSVSTVSNRGKPLAPTTRRRYADTIVRIAHGIGGVRLVDLRASHVERLRDDLLAEGLARQTVGSILGVLSRALSKAVAKGYLGRNPADPRIVNRPHGRPRDLVVIEPDRARRILATVRGVEPWDAAVHLALGLSLRREEVLGLGWSHVDLDDGVVRVERTLTSAGDELHFGPPKSEAGRRELEAPAFVIAALRRHRAAQAERRLLLGTDYPLAGDVDDLIIERGGGEPWHPSTFSTYWFRYARRSGFDGVTFHGLRHGTGALLLDAGIPDAVALSIMGHSAVTMLRHYQGVSKALKRSAADRLDEILGE